MDLSFLSFLLVGLSVRLVVGDPARSTQVDGVPPSKIGGSALNELMLACAHRDAIQLYGWKTTFIPFKKRLIVFIGGFFPHHDLSIGSLICAQFSYGHHEKVSDIITRLMGNYVNLLCHIVKNIQNLCFLIARCIVVISPNIRND